MWVVDPFSNILPFEEPLVYEHIRYSCPETFYQAMRVNNWLVRNKIASLAPWEAKKHADTFPKRANWDEELRFVAVQHALVWKFQPGSKLSQRLLETQGKIEYRDCPGFREGDTSRSGGAYIGTMLTWIRDILETRSTEKSYFEYFGLNSYKDLFCK